MSVCIKCGEMNKDGLKYCVYCGGELIQTEKPKYIEHNESTKYIFCSSCGEKNPGNINNCKYCGAELDHWDESESGNYSSRGNASAKHLLGVKKYALYIILIVVLYVAWFGLIAVFPPVALLAVVIGWKWTGTHISMFYDLSSSFFWGMIIGKVIASAFFGLFIGPIVIMRTVMGLE